MTTSIQVHINHQLHSLAAGANVAQAIALLQPVPPFAVAVNTQFVPKSSYSDYTLQAGDVVDIISPVTGG
jgi:sulfur carrier protein